MREGEEEDQGVHAKDVRVGFHEAAARVWRRVEGGTRRVRHGGDKGEGPVVVEDA